MNVNTTMKQDITLDGVKTQNFPRGLEQMLLIIVTMEKRLRLSNEMLQPEVCCGRRPDPPASYLLLAGMSTTC